MLPEDMILRLNSMGAKKLKKKNKKGRKVAAGSSSHLGAGLRRFCIWGKETYMALQGRRNMQDG